MSAWDREYDVMWANLTATQERCNTLLEEARDARRERDEALATATVAASCLRTAAYELVELRAEVATLRAMLDAKGYG